jgi:hypothetical protein
MLRQLDRNLWVAEQPFSYFGLSVGTRMTVIRLADDQLIVISPIQVDDKMTHELNAIGTVHHIIAPNLYHYLFASHFKSIYPEATFWAAPGLKAKRADLQIDRVIDSNDMSLWPGLESLLFDGFKTLGLNGFETINESIFFHPESRTLILTDATVSQKVVS